MSVHHSRFKPLVEMIEFVTGYRPHKSTAIRWISRGVAGVRLQYWSIGKLKLTTSEAVEQFMEDVARARAKVPFTTASPRRRERSATNAAQELEELLNERSTRN